MTQAIGRYEIERKLGEGGMAVVYLARDPLMKRQVAVKVLPRQFTDDPQFRARFQREAEIIAALEHPHIVPVHDYGEQDGQPYIVMRYMTGGSLADRLRRGPLPLAEAARILAPLGSALDEAHSQNVIHRDLKPGNILFDGRGEPYISDFGIAKLVVEASSRFTGSAILGTPVYMSPEQWRAEQTIDGRSDVYALGGVLFEMLTGRPPYGADTPAQLMYKHLSEPPPRLREVGAKLPDGCDTLIARAMAKERDARYATAGDLAKDLSRLAAGTVPPIGERAPLAPARRAAPQGGHAEAPALGKPTPGDRRPTLGPVGEPTDAPVPVPDPQFASSAAEPPLPETERDHSAPAARAPAGLRAAPIPLTDLGLGAGIIGLLAVIAVVYGKSRLTRPAPAPSAPAERPTQIIPPAQAPVQAPLGIGSTHVSEKDGMVMVYVPAGQFLMGSAADDALAECQKRHRDCLRDWFIDEEPPHAVTLDAYWIDRTEVTNGMYALCVDAGACSAKSSTDSYSRTTYYGDPQYANYPVISVTWDEATAYCRWAARRLPTEAEWEKAARGADGRKYPWGDNPPDTSLANLGGSVGDTAEVGKYPQGASPYGALDMAGNVWEWVNDWYDAGYYGSSSSANPQGPPAGTHRVLRGGSWINVDDNVRAADRYRLVPAKRSNNLGFRCSLSP